MNLCKGKNETLIPVKQAFLIYNKPQNLSEKNWLTGSVLYNKTTN